MLHSIANKFLRIPLARIILTLRNLPHPSYFRYRRACYCTHHLHFWNRSISLHEPEKLLHGTILKVTIFAIVHHVHGQVVRPGKTEFDEQAVRRYGVLRSQLAIVTRSETFRHIKKKLNKLLERKKDTGKKAHGERAGDLIVSPRQGHLQRPSINTLSTVQQSIVEVLQLSQAQYRHSPCFRRV